MRSGVVFALPAVAYAMAAQVATTHAGGVVMAKPPSLPVIVEGVLPGEGWAAGTYTLRGQAIVFNTWKPTRHRLALLAAGTRVTVLSGLCEVSKPDLVSVTAPIPEKQLNQGDSLFRYAYRGEGHADFWADGRWYGNADGAFITEAEGTGCRSEWKARVTEAGRKVWWFRVRLADRRVGWTDVVDSLNPN